MLEIIFEAYRLIEPIRSTVFNDLDAFLAKRYLRIDTDLALS